MALFRGGSRLFPKGIFFTSGVTMIKCYAKADIKQLSEVLISGGSLMGVNLINEDGSIRKMPMEKGWQEDRKLGISTIDRLEIDVNSGVQAFGFHPEDCGIYVIDLDEKKGKSGYETLSRLVGNAEWLKNPSVYCETPNGMHLIFNIESVPEDLRFSENGIMIGVDVRADKLGWLVAPGSLGWSIIDEEWKHYTLEGEFKDAPDFPSELIPYFRWSRQSKQDKKTSGNKVQDMPDYIKGPSVEFEKEELRYSELLDTVEKNMDSNLFHRLVEKYVPAAEWNEKLGHYSTGDYTGFTKGKSCLFSPKKQMIHDFNGTERAMGFSYWLTKFGGMTFNQACRAILEVAGVPDPTAVKISRESVEEIAKETAKETIKAEKVEKESEDEMDDEFYLSVPFPYTDLGNAERFVSMWKERIRFSAENKDWLWFENGVWKRESTSQIQSAIKRTVRSIKTDKVPEEYKKAVISWAKTSESKGHFDAIRNMAGAEIEVFSMEESFDRFHDHLPVKNGVLNLRTGELLPHDQKWMFTRKCPVIFDINAKAPMFEKFIHQVTVGRKDLELWLQHFLGYCLTGLTNEQIFPVFYGTGGNGKSVLINIVNKILGEFSGTLPADALTQSSGGDDKRTSLAAAKGTRIQVMSESRESGHLDTALVKSATGGDPITCRFLHKNFFTYYPTFKIILLTNHKPRISAMDDGIWRRVRNIPFDLKLEDGDKDPELESKLMEELPGILLWMVRGAVLWFDNGMKIPQSKTVDDATKEYQDQENIFKMFIDDLCVVGPEEYEKPGDVIMAFNDWLIRTGNGSRKMQTNKISYMMIQNGFGKKDINKANTVWTGFRLKRDWEKGEK